VSLVRKAEETLKGECLLERGSDVVVACSGGADSVALLHLLHSNREKLGIRRLGVYHLNHGLRGREADADQAFVAELSESLAVPFHPDRADVASYAGRHGLSLEMAGRRLRYRGLTELLKSAGYDYAALGHTATDNLEWLLLSLVRGRAEPLLWGIPARRDRFIRPLIRCTREEVLDYLDSNGLDYREDASNACLDFDRNRVRHCILPRLRELNPSVERTVSRTLALGDWAKSALDAEAREILARLCVQRGKTRELDTSELSDYNPVTQLRVLRLFVPWIRGRDLVRLVPLQSRKGTVEAARSGTERLLVSYDRLIAEPVEEPGVWEPAVLDEGKEVFVEALGWWLNVRSGERSEFERSGVTDEVVCFDASVVKPPFEVRPWREGDRLIPFARHRPVKLKRIFAERKVPRHMRRLWPLVCKDDEILWAAGLKRSAKAPVTAATKRITILTLLRGEDGE